MMAVSGRRAALAVLASGLVLPRLAKAPAAPRASFALIGDVPYGEGEEIKFGRVIEAINASHAAGGVRLVVHTGDIKRGRERCDESLYRRRFALFQRLAPPFVITPGDNDWTDCHRAAPGRYLPTERLAKFRQVFYPRPGWSTGAQPMPVLTQATMPAHRAYVENQLWSLAGVTMATLHVVGSGNDLEPWDGIDRHDGGRRQRSDRLAEFAAREAAALAWTDATFAHARAQQSAGVVVAMQANMHLHLPARATARQGFNRIAQHLAERAREWGQPVLLAHGDSHIFRFDKPLRRPHLRGGLPALENFSRVENFGAPFVHWVQVHIDAATPEVFSVEPHYVAANLWPL
jgi:hypothetical protein